MNLLNTEFLGNSIYKTDEKKSLVIDNHEETYTVYKIRLDDLFYNDQNDRISTWISEYKTENKIDQINKSNLNDYNDLIHTFITNSNKKAIQKTQTNIELISQREPGVVLADGRIIDGNRRYTCLRNIQRKSGKTQYFKAIILDRNLKENSKQIKILELMLQHGVDEKISYNPIDRLVGLYHDTIEPGLLTEEEYADSINESVKSVKDEIECAILLVDFLDFINAPKQFHVARKLNLVDPLKDLRKALKKVESQDEKEDLKNIVFSHFLMQTAGDMTRHVRKISRIVNNNGLRREFINEQMPIVEDTCEKMSEYNEITTKEISKIRADEEIKEKFKHSTEKILNKANGEASRNLPKLQLIKAYDSIDLIDTNIFTKLSIDKKEELIETIGQIEKLLETLKDNINV